MLIDVFIIGNLRTWYIVNSTIMIMCDHCQVPKPIICTCENCEVNYGLEMCGKCHHYHKKYWKDEKPEKAQDYTD